MALATSREEARLLCEFLGVRFVLSRRLRPIP